MKFLNKKITVFFLLTSFLLALLDTAIVHHNEHNNSTAHLSHYFDFQKHKCKNQKIHFHSKDVCKFHECQTHGCHIHKLLPVIISKIHKVQKNTLSVLFFNLSFSFNKNLTLQSKNNIIYKNKPYKNLHLISTPLRGPPYFRIK